MDSRAMPPPRDPAKWPVRVYRLGEEPSDDLSATTTLTERMEMMWLLRDRMWELTGKPLPAYRRSEIPIVVFRR